jgi:hypothetical protein
MNDWSAGEGVEVGGPCLARGEQWTPVAFEPPTLSTEKKAVHGGFVRNAWQGARGGSPVRLNPTENSGAQFERPQKGGWTA